MAARLRRLRSRSTGWSSCRTPGPSPPRLGARRATDASTGTSPHAGALAGLPSGTSWNLHGLLSCAATRNSSGGGRRQRMRRLVGASRSLWLEISEAAAASRGRASAAVFAAMAPAVAPTSGGRTAARRAETAAASVGSGLTVGASRATLPPRSDWMRRPTALQSAALALPSHSGAKVDRSTPGASWRWAVESQWHSRGSGSRVRASLLRSALSQLLLRRSLVETRPNQYVSRPLRPVRAPHTAAATPRRHHWAAVRERRTAPSVRSWQHAMLWTDPDWQQPVQRRTASTCTGCNVSPSALVMTHRCRSTLCGELREGCGSRPTSNRRSFQPDREWIHGPSVAQLP